MAIILGFFFDGVDPLKLRGRIYGRANGGNVQLGILFTSGGITNYAPATFALNTTHFVVAKYTRLPGADNDVAAIFVDAPPGMPEPMPGAISTNAAAGQDVTDIQRFGLRQNASIGVVEVDELRIGTTWADVTSAGVQPPGLTNIVGVVAADAKASEEGVDPGVFTITRSGNTNAIEVFYTLSGTATNGVDYTNLPSSIQFAENVMSANLDLTPIADGITEEAETAILTLTADNAYEIDQTKANAVVTLTDKSTTLIEPFTFLKIKPLAGTTKFVNPSLGFTVKGRFHNQWTNNNFAATIQYALEWVEGTNKINTAFSNTTTKQKITGTKQGKGKFKQAHVAQGLAIPSGTIVNLLLRARQGTENFSVITTNSFQYELK